MTPTNIYDQLRRDEGVVDHVYFLNGIPHFGIGHNGLTGPRLTQPAMAMILKDDVSVTVDQCETLEGWTRLSGARQGVLINMAFNMGFVGLTGFVKMLQAVALQDWQVAAEEMRYSKWYGQDTARAKRLVTQMETGVWQ